MGFYDRHYQQDGGDNMYSRGGHGGGGVTMGLPKPSPAVKWIMIVCGAAFVLQIFSGFMRIDMSAIFGVTGESWWQVWRYVTFQFLHSERDIFHIAMNMLGIYFLGTPLEQRWGTKRFLRFYLFCGIVAGISYAFMTRLLLDPIMWGTPIIGASGGVFGIVLAAAILFPHFRLIMLFFPVPIRLAAMIIFGAMIFVILSGLANIERGLAPGFWSDVAHFGGAAAAGVWVWLIPKLRRAQIEFAEQAKEGAWERKMKKIQEEEAHIDEILDKIKNHGIASLSAKEKKALQQATERQRKEDQRIHRL